MPFFARPDLSDIQFKQLSGSTLHLSGETYIVTPSGLQLSDGISSYVPIIATGGTNNKVLTYINGEIVLKSISGGTGSGVYSGASPTTCTVGGLCSGSPIAGCSISTILEKILVPDGPPTSSIYFTNISPTLRQYGNCNNIATTDLCWSVIKHTYGICAICFSTGGTGTYDGSVVASGCSQSGLVKHTYPATCAYPSSPIASTSATFWVCAKASGGTAAITGTCASVSLTWEDSRYWGGKNVNYYNCSSGTTNTMIDTLCSELSSTGSKCFCNFPVGNNNFFYYAYPKIFGIPQQISVNGLPNNSWGCAALCTLSEFRRCNTNGYCQDFYLVRSDNQISGSFNINITTVC